MSIKIEISDKAIQTFERAFGFLGLGIIALMIYKLGPGRIAANIHAMSWGFFLVILTGGIYYICEAFAWKLLLAEYGKSVSFIKLLRTVLEGDSLNYITITKIGGEALKAYAIKDKMNLAVSAASVIVLKFCSILGFWLVIACGFLTMLFTSDVSFDLKKWVGIGLVVLGLFLFSFSWVQRMGMFKPLSWMLRQFETKFQWISQHVIRLTRLDEKIIETYHARPMRVYVSTMLCSIKWLEEILFIWLVFRFLHIGQDWFVPTLVCTISLLMNSFFFFVPWRAGTQEGTMVLTFTLLDLSEPVGLSLAILKRLRELVWVFIGLILFSLEAMTNQPPAAVTSAPPESFPGNA